MIWDRRIEVFKDKKLAVDFDGTIVTDKFPEIGEPNWEFIEWLKKCKDNGCRLILWTCRNNTSPTCPGVLDNAVEFCNSIGLEFDAINENLPEVKEKWGGDTRKVLADYYLDDKSVIVQIIRAEYLGGSCEEVYTKN